MNRISDLKIMATSKSEFCRDHQKNNGLADDTQPDIIYAK